MTINEIKDKVLNSEEYDFLWSDPHLKNNLCLIGLGGSYAYGTNVETSDLDVRGFAVNSKKELLTNVNFEQIVNSATDTTIYSFNKLIALLTNCNPNTIEILGLRPDHYLYKNSIGELLLENKKLFLSKKAVYSFGGYANQQLYRLNNNLAHSLSRSELEKHILKTIEHASVTYKEKYFDYDEDNIRLYIDKSSREEYDTEIYMDINLSHYPLRDYKGMYREMQEIVKSYNKIGCRNQKAIDAGKITKHMMHLIRLYLMCLDILERGEIITYREKEHDLLMDIRNGVYLKDEKPTAEFLEMVNNFEAKLDYAKANTDLPKNPDYNGINELMMTVNEKVVKGEV